jgi:ADP-heptose:LPS heptosyltransferase/O-antigen ligase
MTAFPARRRAAAGVIDPLLNTLAAACVAVLGPLVALAPRGLPVWALAMTAVCLAATVRSPGHLSPGPLSPVRRPTAAALAALLALMAASTVWSPSHRALPTLGEVGYVTAGLLVAGHWIATRREPEAHGLARLFIGGLVAGLVLFAVDAWLDLPLNAWWNGRASSTSFSLSLSNIPKRSMVLLTVLVWPAALMLTRRGLARWGLALPLAFGAVGLSLTSRSAMAGAVIGLATLALAWRWPGAVRRLLAGVLVVCFVGVLPAVTALHRAGLEDAEWLFPSARHRVEIWSLAANRVWEAPVLGHGLDASRALMRLDGEVSRFAPDGDTLLPLHPHNAFLQVWLELGAAGAALMLLLGLRLVAMTRPLATTDQPYALALLASALAMVTTSYGLWQAWWMAGLLAGGLMLMLALRVPPPGRPGEKAGGARVLVIKLGAFGDFFLAQTALEAIRRHHAGDGLVLLTIPALAPLARMSGLFDEVWEDPRRRSPAAYLAMGRRLRAGRFDRVYDLQCQRRTDIYFWMLAPGPWPAWSGTARGCSHPDRYPGRRRAPVTGRYARQLAPFGMTLAPFPDLGWLDADTGGFGLTGDYALLVPGASPRRPDKRWPAGHYGELARALAARGLRPVVLGTAEEAPLATAIVAACPEAVDLTGRTGAPDIGGLARRARLTVGNDTGPTHLAAAIGCPTVMVVSDASNPIHINGPRVAVHHRPDLAAIDVAGVLATAEGLMRSVG